MYHRPWITREAFISDNNHLYFCTCNVFIITFHLYLLCLLMFFTSRCSFLFLRRRRSIPFVPVKGVEVTTTLSELSEQLCLSSCYCV